MMKRLKHQEVKRAWSHTPDLSVEYYVYSLVEHVIFTAVEIIKAASKPSFRLKKTQILFLQFPPFSFNFVLRRAGLGCGLF